MAPPLNSAAPIAREADERNGIRALQGVRRAWISAGICVLVIGLAMGGTFRSLFETWLRSNTFAHGLVIVPIAAWLIYRQRHELARIEAKPYLPAVPVVLVLSLLWFVSRTAGALVAEEIFAVLSVIAVPLAVLGLAVFRHIAYPLAFLILAVPFGEWLIPPMMEFTADFTVAALRVVGIPVLREGLYFSIPSGNFLVAEACSGIRYFMASVTMGALYAYLALRSPWRRAALIAIATLLPVVANGVRAFGIVLLAHLSNMQLAAGADHLIYGWLFFGVVVALLLWIGSFLREPVDEAAAVRGVSTLGEPVSTGRIALVSILLCAAVAIGPALWAAQSARFSALQPVFAPQLPATGDSWTMEQLASPGPGPQFRGVDGHAAALYSSAHGTVEAWIAYYEIERPGHELIGDNNSFFDGSRYGVVNRGSGRAVGMIESMPPVTTLHIRGTDGDWLVWYWYQVGRIQTASPVYVKLLTAIDVVSTPYDGRAAVALYTRAEPDSVAASARLESFLRTFHGDLAACATPTDSASCVGGIAGTGR